MGVIGGPDPIVQDSLVFALDPGSKRSYISGSSTCTSIVSSDTGTLTADVIAASTSSAFFFDGTTNKIQINNYFNDVFTSNTFTVNFWAKPSVLSSWKYIMSNGYPFQIATNGTQLRLYLSNNNAGGYYVPAYSPGNVDVGTWYNATIVNSAADSRQWYLNGVSAGAANTGNDTPGASTHTAGGLVIGQWADGSLDQHGFIGPIHIYNKALSAAEVLQNYNALKDRFD